MELSRRIVHAIAYLNPTETPAALEPLCWNWWDKYADKTGLETKPSQSEANPRAMSELFPLNSKRWSGWKWQKGLILSMLDLLGVRKTLCAKREEDTRVFIPFWTTGARPCFVPAVTDIWNWSLCLCHSFAEAVLYIVAFLLKTMYKSHLAHSVVNIIW